MNDLETVPGVIRAVRERADLVGCEAVTDMEVMARIWSEWMEGDGVFTDEMILNAANACRAILEMEPISAP